MQTTPQVTDHDRCIVLPFQTQSWKETRDCGLALHFLLGNVLVLHPGLQEFWFGWRAARIFPDFNALLNYCRDSGQGLNLQKASSEQNIRFWISGLGRQNQINMHLYDAQAQELTMSQDIAFSCQDDLTGFRSGFLDWFGKAARPFPARQQPAALWPEKINMQGLQAVGSALLEFYKFSFPGDQHQIRLQPFEQAVLAAPDSFMAHNLLGWALFRNQEVKKAAACFQQALSIHPLGAGAMAGLMWCALKTGDQETSVYWAGHKAESCTQDVEAAKKKARQRFEQA